MTSFARNALIVISVAISIGIGTSLAHQGREDPGTKIKAKYEWSHGGCIDERAAEEGDYKNMTKCLGLTLLAGPPPWAPAHGYRHRHRHHQDYEPYRLSLLPLDLDTGRCNREIIGQLIGGAVGAAAGSEIGSGSGRVAAIIGGSIIGVLLGGDIGRTMDRQDALCVDQTLEYIPDGQTVSWTTGEQDYQVTPQRTFQTGTRRYCREYQAQSTVGGKIVETHGIACRGADGDWKIVE